MLLLRRGSDGMQHPYALFLHFSSVISLGHSGALTPHHQNSSTMATHAATKAPAPSATTPNQAFRTDRRPHSSNLARGQPTRTPTITMPTATDSATTGSSTAAWGPSARPRHVSMASGSCLVVPGGTFGCVGRLIDERVYGDNKRERWWLFFLFLIFFVHISFSLFLGFLFLCTLWTRLDERIPFLYQFNILDF